MKKCIQAMLSNDMPQEHRADILKKTKMQLLKRIIEEDENVFIFRQEEHFLRIGITVEIDEGSKIEMNNWLQGGQ